jgi:prepilin-type N-terminal cleavage/methylation domain-containing protein
MNKQTGFTLVEIMVATVILSLVILGMVSVFVAGKRHVISARDRMTGSEISKLFIDPLQMYVRQDTWGAAGNALNSGTTSGPSVKIGSVDYTPQYDVSNTAGLRRVKAQISWPDSSP